MFHICMHSLIHCFDVQLRNNIHNILNVWFTTIKFIIGIRRSSLLKLRGRKGGERERPKGKKSLVSVVMVTQKWPATLGRSWTPETPVMRRLLLRMYSLSLF